MLNQINLKLFVGVIAVVLAVGIISVSDLSYSDSVEPMHHKDNLIKSNATEKDPTNGFNGELVLYGFFLVDN